MKFPITIPFVEGAVLELYPYHIILAALIVAGLIWWGFVAFALFF